MVLECWIGGYIKVGLGSVYRGSGIPTMIYRLPQVRVRAGNHNFSISEHTCFTHGMYCMALSAGATAGAGVRRWDLRRAGG